jgi:hypothetical protein
MTSLKQGIEAFRRGDALSNNPFTDPLSDDFNEWEFGWNWAKKEPTDKPEPKCITKYHEAKPKRGKGKNAWERYESEMKKAPKQIYYAPNYFGQNGWICEWDIDLDKHPRGHGRSYETFYASIIL